MLRIQRISNASTVHIIFLVPELRGSVLRELHVLRMEFASGELTRIRTSLLNFYLQPYIHRLLRIIDLLKGQPTPFVAGHFQQSVGQELLDVGSVIGFAFSSFQ